MYAVACRRRRRRRRLECAARESGILLSLADARRSLALSLSLSSRPRIPGGGGSTRPQLPQPPPYNSIHYIAARSRTDRGCTAQSVSVVSDRGRCSRCRLQQPYDCVVVVVGFASSRFSPRLQILSTGTCRQRGSHSLTHSLTACRWPQSQEETGNNLPLVYRNRHANITQMQQGLTSHSTQNRSLQQTNKHSVYKRPDSNSCIDLRTVRSIRMLAAAWFFLRRSESWTLRKNEDTRLDAFEMKGQRKILRVSWTAKKRNEWVLNKAGVKRELLDAVKARKLA